MFLEQSYAKGVVQRKQSLKTDIFMGIKLRDLCFFVVYLFVRNHLFNELIITLLSMQINRDCNVQVFTVLKFFICQI